MKLRIFTVAFGPKHLELFKSRLHPSLSHQVHGLDTIWNFFGDKAPEGYSSIHFHPFTSFKMHFLNEIRACIDTNSPLLMAPPDTVFSENALQSLLTVGSFPGTCVGFTHVRVNPSFPLSDGTDLSGPSLVKASWNHLHHSWTNAHAIGEYANSYVGGVSWRFINESLIAVQHRLPTIYLANFTEDDFDFFLSRSFGDWDHVWPSFLIQKDRYRYIGSSDAAFAAEITDENSNIPPLQIVDPSEPDAFGRHQLHNRVNRQFVSILRRG